MKWTSVGDTGVDAAIVMNWLPSREPEDPLLQCKSSQNAEFIFELFAKVRIEEVCDIVAIPQSKDLDVLLVISGQNRANCR